MFEFKMKKAIRNTQYFFNRIIGHTKKLEPDFNNETLKNISVTQFLKVLDEYCKRNFEYKSDGKLDFSMHPEYFAWRKAGDCDDWALFCLAVCRMVRSDIESSMLIVRHNEDGKRKGHAVCLCYDILGGNYYHIGNWGLQGPFEGSAECLRSIYEDYDEYYLLDYNFDVIREYKA